MSASASRLAAKRATSPVLASISLSVASARLYDVPHALPRYARKCRDLGEGKVLVVVQVEILPLLVRKQLAVKVEEHRPEYGILRHFQATSRV